MNTKLSGSVLHVTDTLNGERVSEQISGRCSLVVAIVLLQAHEKVFHAFGIKPSPH